MNPGRKLLDRLTAWSPVMLLAALAALTYWLNAQVQPPTPRPDGSTRHDPDIYVDEFRARSFAADGSVSQSLAARGARHFPDDDSTEFTGPSIELTEPGRPRFAVTADRATLAGNHETITFAGNVRAVRDAPPAGTPGAERSGPITVTTDFLRVFPKLDRADTDRPVTIAESRGIIHAVGMELDNRTRRLELKSSVRGTLQPAPAK